MSDRTQEQDQRAAYISGLRKLADLLEKHDELPTPFEGSNSYGQLAFTFFRHEYDDPKAAMAAAARVLPGLMRKQGDNSYFHLNGRIDGLYVKFLAERKDVCERVVIGTEEVEVEAREGEDTRPVVMRTETRELVEWRCSPLLADNTAEAVA